MANLYCCKIEEDGWGVVYTTQKEYIFANDIDDARITICRQWGIRKNKKGLRIEEVKPHYAKITQKTTNDLVTEKVWNTFMQHAFEEKSYKRITHYFCSECTGEIEKTTKICTHCGAFIR